MEAENETIRHKLLVEVLSASVAGKDLASVTIHLAGEFERDGNRISVDVTLVPTVPAKIVPARSTPE